MKTFFYAAYRVLDLAVNVIALAYVIWLITKEWR